MENNSGRVTVGQFMRCVFLTPLVVAPVALAVYLLKLTDDPAAWVQAVGSVVAILAAWYIPYQHELGREKRRRQEVMTTIGALATRQAMLFRNMIMAMEDEPSMLSDWQNNHQDVEWRIHQQVLNDFPLALLAGFDISLLINLREGAAYGCSCADKIMLWTPTAYRHHDPETDPIQTARFHLRRTANTGQLALSE